MSNRCHDTARTGVMSHPHPRGVTLTLGGRHHAKSQSKIPSPHPQDHNGDYSPRRATHTPRIDHRGTPTPSIHKCPSTARKSNAEYPRVIAHTPTGKTVLKAQAGNRSTLLNRGNRHADLQTNLHQAHGRCPPGARTHELRPGWKIWPSNAWSKYCRCGKEMPHIPHRRHRQSRSGHRIRQWPLVVRSGVEYFYI
jgi:hypothetical protein